MQWCTCTHSSIVSYPARVRRPRFWTFWTRKDDDKDYCGEEVMKRRRRTTTRIWTFVWFPLREKRKMNWYYCHLYGSHRTLRYSLHPIAAWHHQEWSLHYHLCTNSSVPPRHHHRNISSIPRLYIYTWNNSVVIILGGTDTDMIINSTRRLTIHHHHPTCQPLLSFCCTYQHNHI